MFLLQVTLGGLLFNGFRGLCFNLAGCLVLGQVVSLLNFALTSAQMLVMLLLLKGSTAFCFELLGALASVRNVSFQLGCAFLETLHCYFQRSDRAESSVSDAGRIAIPAAHHDFDGVV